MRLQSAGIGRSDRRAASGKQPIERTAHRHPPQAHRWVQSIVVATSEWPSSACTVRMSVPLCSRCGAKQWQGMRASPAWPRRTVLPRVGQHAETSGRTDDGVGSRPSAGRPTGCPWEIPGTRPSFRPRESTCAPARRQLRTVWPSATSARRITPPCASPRRAADTCCGVSTTGGRRLGPGPPMSAIQGQLAASTVPYRKSNADRACLCVDTANWRSTPKVCQDGRDLLLPQVSRTVQR